MFVNLEAIYPAPEEPGTELSFEELWAASRGWLDCDWAEENLLDEEPQHHQQSENQPSQVDLLSGQLKTKLVVHRDTLMLDENGALKDIAKPFKSKKKKVMEVNETQISQYPRQITHSAPSGFHTTTALGIFIYTTLT